MVSSASPHSMQNEGPTKPLFKRLSQVRILECETSHKKSVTFGQCLRFQIFTHTSESGGGFDWALSW
jgi:hypothetical protein